MKLHIGNGAVYLRDWVNVDLPLPHVFLTSERPDLVEKFIADESDYYARHRDKTRETTSVVPKDVETVCDRHGSFSFIPARDGAADELLSRQVFEHLSASEGMVALRECHRVLERGGMLRIDVPDPDTTLELYRKTGDKFWVRHLFGPRRNEYGGHTPYTRGMVISMAARSGFEYAGEEPNIHEDFYPAFCLRFEKP